MAAPIRSHPALSLALWLPMACASAAGDLAGLLAAVEEARVEHQIPGVALTLVDRRGIVWTGGFGVTDLATDTAMTADTLIRIGSITKAFTALAILMLVEDGKLELQAPVRRYLDPPPYDNPWEAQQPVRLAHLLEHTAGLRDLSKVEWDSKDPTPLTLAQAFALDPESRRLQVPPGRHSSYSNVGAGIAAAVLEAVDGRSYEQFMEQRLFGPLGMERTNLLLSERVRAELATGYDRDGRTILPYWHMVYRPFGAINTSARQMAKFVRLLLNDGELDGRRLLRPASIRRMEAPATSLAARDGLRYGYGLGIYQFVHAGRLLYGHGGDADGFLAHFGVSRDTGLGFFVVINAFKGRALRAIRAPVQDVVVAAATPREPPVPELPPDALQPLTGTYLPATVRFRHEDAGRPLQVLLIDGTLYTRTSAGRQRPLLAVTGRHFRRPGQPVATAAFVRDGDGALYLQGEMGNYRRTGP